MGLAASQARFLGITARKSNIEYEGQQVNQQRTALAEEVNALYNKLISMKKPIPPDETDFYRTDYTFEVSNSSGADGSYRILDYKENADGTYYITGERTYNKTVAVGKVYENANITIEKEEIAGKTEEVHKINTIDGSFRIYSGAKNSDAMAQLINDTYGKDPTTGRYPIQDGDKPLSYYVDNNGLTHYIPRTQTGKGTHETINTYTSENTQATENVVYTDAEVTFDEHGRFSKISIRDEKTGKTIVSGADVNTTRYNDTEGYDKALKDYTMSQDEYDKRVADLNNETKSLQQEDKILELRLNQIDTEQNELQTELDAVKAVLDKNIEKTFNTFS